MEGAVPGCEKRSGFSVSLFISRDCQLLIAADLNSIMNWAKCQTWGHHQPGTGCANGDWMKKWCGGINTRCKHLRFLSEADAAALVIIARPRKVKQLSLYGRPRITSGDGHIYAWISPKSNNPGLHWWLIMRTLRTTSGSMFIKIPCVFVSKGFGIRIEMHFHSTSFFFNFRHTVANDILMKI